VKGPLTVLGTLAVVTGFINMVPVQKVLGLEGIDILHRWLDNEWGAASRALLAPLRGSGPVQ